MLISGRKPKKRVQAGFFAVKRIARRWSLDTERGRSKRGGLSTVRELRVMRCVLEGTLLACSKSRVWSRAQERKANQVLARGIRRCLGLDRYNMRQFSYSDESLRELVKWDHFSTLVHRNVLRWLGHVARMSCARLPKMALFGWPKGHEEHRSGKYTFPMWAQWLLTKHRFSQMDWFRLAEKPTRNWVRMLNQVLPRSWLSARQVLQVNQWRPGDAVPDAVQIPPAVAPLSSNPLQCPACQFVADTSKGLQVHYDSFSCYSR